MELILNSLWAMVAIALVRLGRRHAQPVVRHASLTSLVLSAAILFKVISISDDLWSQQNPADRNNYQRRDHQASSAQFSAPMTAALPESPVAELSFSFQRLAVQLHSPSPAIVNPAFGAIQNRPPPTP